MREAAAAAIIVMTNDDNGNGGGRFSSKLVNVQFSAKRRRKASLASLGIFH